MIDYKYHVTSLVAVFLALGVGILIGSMALGQEFIGEQQEALINRLEGDFQQLRIQNGLTRSELVAANNKIKEYEEICRKMMPAIIKDKLQNYRVVVIETGNGCSLENILGPLETAGAEVEAVISVLSDFSLANVSTLNYYPENTKDGNVLNMLGEAIIFGDEKGVIDDLAKRKLVKFSGSTGRFIDAVILAGGSKTDMAEQAKWLDLGLTEYFLQNNVNVIGVEPSSAGFSYMSFYRSKPIATIDNIDSIPGQISLVYSVLGEKGHFGIKETSETLMPELW
ncbi:MAG: copper transporter [Bacillota bacterium]|nr:copper transporter [Clostridia bacterium]